MFESCPTCGGSGLPQPFRPDLYDYEDLSLSERRCSSCVRGRVVSESVIEEMARAIYHAGIPDHPDPDDIRYLARAAARVVLEHMEDSERKPG